ncbi:hypothetical protein Mapa_003493 [Marchantia paleacea]|nr:hypothetical protein Mapa_003493 [Marchantia paleacea]
MELISSSNLIAAGLQGLHTTTCRNLCHCIKYKFLDVRRFHEPSIHLPLHLLLRSCTSHSHNNSPVFLPICGVSLHNLSKFICFKSKEG